jgi:hypothetical protein
MKIIKGDLVLKENYYIDDDLKVEGNIRCEGGLWNLDCGDLNCLNLNCGDLKCWDLNCGDLKCWDLKCWDLNCGDLNCWDLNCGDLNCGDLNCGDLNCLDLDCGNLNCGNLNCGDLNCLNLNFYALAIAYKSFKCKSWKARRENYIIKCLDGEIEVKEQEQSND